MNNPYYLKDAHGDYYGKYPEFQAWEEGKQAGIKEVLEWIQNKGETLEAHSGKVVEFNLRKEEWLSKLKEWGIK